MQLGHLGRAFHVLLGGAHHAVGDVVANARAEQVHVLVYDAHVVAQGLQREIPDVRAIDGDFARRHVVEARQQADHGGLSAARRAQDRRYLSWPGVQVHLPQRRRPVFIGERDVIEANVTVGAAHVLCVGPLGNR